MSVEQTASDTAAITASQNAASASRTANTVENTAKLAEGDNNIADGKLAGEFGKRQAEMLKGIM